jgi:hypothetical protein
MERVQVNTVKVALWTHALRCAGLVEWAPPDDGDGDPALAPTVGPPAGRSHPPTARPGTSAPASTHTNTSSWV